MLLAAEVDGKVVPVVFEDLEPDLDPELGRRRVPRWLPVAGAVVVVGLVVAFAARGGDRPPVASDPTPSAGVVSFVPTAARGVVDVPESAAVVVVDQYAVPGVMTVAGRVGWKLEVSASSADVRRYRALDLATGTLHPTVTFEVADRAPLATIEAETTRYTDGLAGAGASGFTSALAAFEDTVAADLTYTTAGGRYVMERLWLHDGIALFVRISDVWAETVATLFDDTVRYGALTP